MSGVALVLFALLIRAPACTEHPHGGILVDKTLWVDKGLKLCKNEYRDRNWW